jgi:hypothetical protein
MMMNMTAVCVHDSHVLIEEACSYSCTVYTAVASLMNLVQLLQAAEAKQTGALGALCTFVTLSL